MTQKLGYLVELDTVKFDEGTDQSWMQAMPLGEYDHPVYGKIAFTAERIQRFADNVNKGVRGTELDIDYDHKAKTDEAAGWVKKAEARPDGLWILVEWTKTAAQKIREKAYRYFSPEFHDTWTHPKDKVEFKDVLFGGGITNRPFLKDILPLNLSEAFEKANDTNHEGVQMPDILKGVKEKLGLPEDATDEQVLVALDKKQEAVVTEPPKETVTEPEKELVTSGAPQLSEEIKKLSESNPIVKHLMDVIEAQGTQLQDNSKQLKEAAVAASVKSLSDKATEKGYALTPVASEALSKVLSEVDSTVGAAVVQLTDKHIDAGLVKLGEIGGGRPNGEIDAVKQFTDAVAKVQEERKLNYGDAVVAVSSEQPQLFTEYRAASYAGRE